MRTVGALAGVCAVLAGVPASAEAGGFQSPSKNIGCFISAKYGVRCDIGKRTWSPPAKPAGCDLDFGQGVFVGTGHAGFVCAGDTDLHQGGVLAYGKTKTAGHYSCRSLMSGMKCANNRTHHGFVLSVQSYRFF